ncbi:MAG: glycerol-3-phosphate 1-O-acyltransferase PlsY [Alphaproteobacteria bacterium]
MLSMIHFPLFALLITYTIGSIPFGYILSLVFGGKDIRTQGSGNIGATNVYRNLGKTLAFLTLLGDVLKGALPFYLFPETDPRLLLAAVVVGHVFPVWLKFNGGKGVATSLGALLAGFPIVGSGVALLWLLVAVLSKTSSLAALIAFATAPLWAWFFYSPAAALYMAGLWGFLLWTHRTNICRLWHSNETSL